MEYLWKGATGRQRCRSRPKWAVLSAALLIFLISFVAPTHLIVKDAIPDEELTRIVESRRSLRNAKVYAVLKLKTQNLSESTIQELAATIISECEKHLLDPVLVLGVMFVESKFHHKAVSSTGARGLMQILPGIAAPLAQEAGLEDWKGLRSLYDPVINAKIGVYYLGYLKDRFEDVHIVLAAYRWGPTKVQEKLKNNRSIPSKYAHEVLSVARSYRDRPAHASNPDEQPIEMG